MMIMIIPKWEDMLQRASLDQPQIDLDSLWESDHTRLDRSQTRLDRSQTIIRWRICILEWYLLNSKG